VLILSTVSVQLEVETIKLLDEISKEGRTERSYVIRKLLRRALQKWRVDRALRLLRRGEISVGKAAEIADITISELLELATKHDITRLLHRRPRT
jgi:metal-responsive CopG/Arc/MetJ family transcriptional regulator